MPIISISVLYRLAASGNSVSVAPLLGASAAAKGGSLSAIKSLFTFAQRKLGILPVNAAAPVTLPKQERKLAERILPKNIVEQLIELG